MATKPTIHRSVSEEVALELLLEEGLDRVQANALLTGATIQRSRRAKGLEFTTHESQSATPSASVGDQSVTMEPSSAFEHLVLAKAELETG